MPRNRGLVRVLSELRAMEATRRGLTLIDPDAEARVSTRTIRRDPEALQAAGMPLVDGSDEAGRRRWRVFDREEAA
jgi:predicted DNA-binding transcriptional regulator YafY